MKRVLLRNVSLLAGLITSSLASAQEITTRPPVSTPHSKLRASMTLLVRDDARKDPATPKTETSDSIAEEAENIVLLEPLVITDDKRTPEFTAPRETVVAKVLRTGTLVQHVGKKTTVRLWTSGDAGVVLSFRW